MKKLSLLFTLAAAGLLAGCSSTANSNMNANANRSNTNLANMNANSNSNSNAGSSGLANAAAKLTTDSPEDFMEAAAQGGMAEVELSKIALQKSQNAEIKKFAQMMVTDHTKAGTELKALAATKKITLPTDLGSHQDDLDDLKGAETTNFDREYVDTMVSNHESTVAAFQEQADKSADAEVKAFAAKTLPTLKMHLEMIKGIQAKMK